MPTVPVSPQRVREAALPAFRVQPVGDVTAYGGGVGRATEKLGQVIEARAIERQKEIDTKAVLDISNQFDADNIAFFHDKKKGLFSQEKDAAQGSYEKTVNYFKEKTKQYEGLTRNENQKQLLMGHLNGRIQTYLYNASIHESKEYQEARKSTLEATKQIGMQGVAANYTNQEGIKSFLETTVSAIRANANGKPMEAVKQEALSFTTQAIVGAIERAIDEKQPDIARKLYDTYEKYISPVVKGKVVKAIDTGERKGFILNTIDNMKTSPEYQNSDGTLNLKAGLDYWEQEKDPDKREEGKNKWKAFVSDSQAIKHQQDNLRMDEYLKQITKPGTVTTQAQLEQLLSSAGFTGRDFISAQSLGKQVLGADKIATTPEVWKEAHDRLLSGDIKDSTQLWREYGDKMSFLDLKSFTGSLDTMAKALGKLGEKTLDKDGVKTMIKEIADQKGLKGDNYKEFLPTLYSKLEGEFQAKADQKKGSLTESEIRTIVAEQLIKVTVEPGWMGTPIGKKQEYLFKIPAGTEFTKSGLPVKKVE